MLNHSRVDKAFISAVHSKVQGMIQIYGEISDTNPVQTLW